MPHAMLSSRARHHVRKWSSRAMLLVALLLTASALGYASERAIKSRVPPVYPEIARRMHISGAVKVSATVDADGKVIDVKPVSGNSMLANAAIDAVRKWRFEPGTEQSTVELEINFVAPQ